MTFDIFNFLICLIEVMSMLLFARTIDDNPFSVKNYIISFAAMLIGSVFITFLDSVSASILIFNYIILFTSFWLGFKKPIKETLFNSLFSFLLLLYFQSFIIVFIPTKLLGTNLGNLMGDSFIFVVALTLCLFSNKYKWARYYKNSIKLVWSWLTALCVPEIIIVQYLATRFDASSRQTIIILVLLQLIYIAAIFAFFAVVNHRNNYAKLLQTQKHIEDLDGHLDASRKSIHDFNKHIKYLHNMVMTNSNDDALKQEIDIYCKDLINIYDDEEILLQLDEPIFRALLYGRQTQAAKNNIEFLLDSTAVLPKFPIENYKFVEIFDNLMDNAFECVTKLKSSKKWIKVNLSFEQKDNKYYHTLTIHNPYEELNISEIMNCNNYTTKGKSHMGIGLKKVTELVDDTGGNIFISTDNNIFSVKITYCVDVR